MDFASIKKWLIFFCGILVAIIIADQLSNVIVAASGISGWSKIPVSFILYAVLFFAILYAIQGRAKMHPVWSKQHLIGGQMEKYTHGHEAGMPHPGCHRGDLRTACRPAS